jgi:uncharacterized protein YodC (DUF2158 family)
MKIGDRVQLTCGGPVMTVTATASGDRWGVHWWSAKEEKFLADTFPAAALKAYSEPSIAVG